MDKMTEEEIGNRLYDMVDGDDDNMYALDYCKGYHYGKGFMHGSIITSFVVLAGIGVGFACEWAKNKYIAYKEKKLKNEEES